MKPVLLDTGVIVALLDRSERHHELCRELVEGLERPMVTCEGVIAESCFLMRELPGAALAVLDNVHRATFQIHAPLRQSAGEVRKWMAKYSDRKIDLADACLIQLATELETGDILTLDHDFAAYRWARNRPFHLMPGG